MHRHTHPARTPKPARRAAISRVVITAALCLASSSMLAPFPGPASAQEAGEGDPVAAPFRKMTLKPFIFSLIKRGRVKGTVTIEIVLELGSAEALADAALRRPQIRSDALSALKSLSKQRFDVFKPVDPDLVAAYLQPYMDRRLGKGASKILVQYAVVQPL